jgi:hypothetical protein
VPTTNERRMEIEKLIARKLIEDAVKAGFFVQIDNGEDRSPKSQDVELLVKKLQETDTDYIYIYKSVDDDRPDYWAFLVYGNSGFDVIADYNTHAEFLIKPVMEYSDTFEEECVGAV